MWLPVGSRWRYDWDPVLTHRSVQGGAFIKHKKFWHDTIMYAKVIGMSILMAKDQISELGHTPLGMSKSHDLYNFRSSRSVDDTDQIWSSWGEISRRSSFKYEGRKWRNPRNWTQNGRLPVEVRPWLPETFLCVWSSSISLPNFVLLRQSNPNA